MGEVAITVAGGGAITIAYKSYKAWKRINKSLGANPFKGKTAAKIDEMFRKKGFQFRGPEPQNGTGGYVNPNTNRSYHIDPEDWGKYSEPNHIDVNRARSYSGSLSKKKYPFGG